MTSWTDKYSLLIFQSLDSSNNEARRLYQAGVRKNLVLWAKSQTEGKGRNDRRWDSPLGNLYVSILIAERYKTNLATKFSFVTIVALGEAIKELINDELNINYKWPNDLLLENKKLAGILLESIYITQDEIDGLIIGVGCNLEFHPPKTSYGATCLKEHGYNIEVADLLNKFVEKFTDNKNLFDLKGFGVIRDKWKEKIFGLRKNVSIKTNNREIFGILNDIDEDGRAVIELSNGEYHKIDSGELFFLNKENEFTE